MEKASKYDLINIHDHGATPSEGVFTIENLMIHEARYPEVVPGIAYSAGIHPWFLDKDSLKDQLARLRNIVAMENVIAVGEAGYDKLRGTDPGLQRDAFHIQAELSEEIGKPLFIHCVRSWDELFRSFKEINPGMAWIVHGFRGKAQLARQLTEKGFYISPWVEWAILPESSETLRAVPPDRLFLETDGFDIEIEPVYRVVADHLQIEFEVLSKRIVENFDKVFKINQ